MKHHLLNCPQHPGGIVRKLLLLFVLLVIEGFVNKINAQVLTEDFSYTSGTSLVSNGYVATSGTGTNDLTVNTSGLTYTGSPSSGVGFDATFTTTGQDAYKAITAITSGSIYASFFLNISSAQAAGDYCLGLITGTGISPAFATRVYIRSSGGGFNFGIAKGSQAAAYEATVRTTATTYLVVVKYTYNTVNATDDIINLWVDPALGGTEGAATITTVAGTTDASATGISGFFIRQGTASNAPAGQVDGIRIGTTWASVTPLVVTATLANITQPTGNITIGNNDVVLSGFTVSATASADFTGVTISTSGTASSSDINTVRVFRDFDGNGAINGLDSSVSGAGATFAASIPLTISGETGITTARNYLIVANVDGAATAGNTVTASVGSGAFTTTAATNTGSATGNSRTIAAAAAPTINIIGTLAAFSTAVGTPSAVQTYSVAGVNLSTDITLTPPAEFEISLDNGIWINSSNDTTLTPVSNEVDTTTIYVRYNPASAGAHSGNITHTSTGATSQNQPVSGNSIATQPGTPPTVYFGTITGNSMVINFPGGSGSSRIVVVRSGSAPTFTPTDGNPVPAGVNSNFTTATDQGSGSKIVYDGSDTTVNMTGLASTTDYYVAVYEYNGSGATSNYLLTAGTGNDTTGISEPNVPATITANCPAKDTIVLNFSGGNGASRIVVAHAGSPVSYTPTDGFGTIGVNNNFSLAADQGSGNKVVYDGSGSFVVVIGLSSSTTYYFTVYEYNGLGATADYLTSSSGSTNLTTSGDLNYSVTGSTYFQNFDSLPNTGTFSFAGLGNGPRYLADCPVAAKNVTGWQFGKTGGSGTNLIFNFNNGASTSGAVYSYGSNGSNDRALGALSTGTTANTFGLVLVNNTTDPLTTVTISYVGEQWRNGGGTGIPNTTGFLYKIGGTLIDTSTTFVSVPALNFVSPVFSTTPATLDGNLGANQDTLSATFNLNGNWMPGDKLILRWDDINDPSNDHGLAIDSFSFEANTSTSPTAQDSMFSFSSVTTVSMSAEWLKGDGMNSIVKINTTNSFTNPVDLTGYAANNVYSGSGEQVVYNGSGDSVNITGLTAGTLYYFRVYGYNGSGASARYITSLATENPDTQSTNSPSAAAKLAIISVNGGVNPIVGTPFDVIVQSQDTAGNPQAVGVNTNFDLSVFSGIGTLTGASSGMIAIGTSTDTVTGVIYDTPDQGVQLEATVTAGDPLTSGQSATFDVLDTASALAFATVPVTGIVNTIVGTISVNAIRADLTTDINYTDSITLSVNTGPGTISGTIKLPAVSGTVNFTDIQFSLPGTYTLLASSPGLTSGTSSSIIITAPPALTELVIPQFIGSKTTASTNNDRTPIAMCIQVDNLVPGGIYDIRMGVDTTTAPGTSYGAGNFWTGGPTYTGFIIDSAFTADPSGSSGPYWLYMQPATSRFEPGYTHNLRVSVVLTGGLFPTAPSMIGSKTITALDIPTAARDTITTNDGAFLKGSSVPCIGGKHVLIYNNTAGTGDPLYSYLAMPSVPVNSSQTGLPALISDVFSQSGSSVAGDYAAVIPIGANNPSGVQRIELRNQDNTIFNSATDADGIWPSGANTTTIGRRAIATITDSDASFNTVSVSTTSTPETCLGNDGTATATASGAGSIDYLWSNGATTAALTGLTAGTYSVTVTDDNGCTATSSVTVASPSSATITPSGPTTFCAPGSVTLTAGTAVSYLWSNGDTTQSTIITTSGSYTVTVDDGLGCQITSAPVTVTVNTFGIAGTIYSENLGTPGGTVQISTYTGFQNGAPVSYSSTSPSVSDIRQTLPSSGYSGASGFGNVFFTTSGPLRNFNISGINTIGYSNIVLTYGLKRDGGGTTDQFITEYSTDGINYTQVDTVVRTGTTWALETVSVTLPATCNLRLRFSKNNGASFRLDDVKLTGSTTTPLVCPPGPINLCPGDSVRLTSNILTSNVWAPGASTAKSIVVNSGSGASYSVIATDPNGCTATSPAVIVTDVTAPVVSVTGTDLTCNGDSSGSASSSIVNGTNPFAYSWNTTPVQTTASISNLDAGTYILNVTDSNGCKGADTVIIAEPAALVISNFNPVSGCEGDTVLIVGTNLSGVTAVLFNGDSATFTVLNATTVSAIVPAGATSGNITVLNTDSCYGTSGSSFTYIPCINNVTLNLKMFIQGYYTGNYSMDNFGGGGCLFLTGVSADPTHSDVVTISAMNPITLAVVESVTDTLKTNGTVSVTFSPAVVVGNSYYIKVIHRSAIETWSADSVLFSATTSYDFSTAQTQAFGGNMIQVGTSFPPDTATWAFFSGDISDPGLGVGFQDGIVESTDYADMENAVYNIAGGYVVEDITGDNIVESADYALMENAVIFIVSRITP
jgi:hypothetical protein